MSVKNIKLDGKTYYNVSKLKVLNADNTSIYNDFICTDDATISASKVLLGSVGYGVSGKIIGGYVPANIVSGNATGNIYANGINFLDEYGRILYSYQLSDLPLAELPAVPVVSGYSFAWTMTLEEVNALEGGAFIALDITATTLDTYVYPNEKGWLTNQYTFYFSNGATAQSLTIDWGDGTTPTSTSMTANQTNKSVSHTFSSGKGQSVIKITSEGYTYYLGSGGSGSSTYSFGGQKSSTGINACKRMDKIMLGKNVLLAQYAFNGNPNTSSSATISTCGYPSLTKILIPNSCTYIGSDAFNANNKLATIVIPKSVSTIYSNTFNACIGLSLVYLCEGVTTISDSAFAGTYSIKNLCLPNSLTSIGSSNAFNYSKANYHIKSELWLYTCTRAQAAVNSDVFVNGKLLTNVTVPNTVTSISAYALSFRCITSITLPSTITSIGNYAFAGTSITSMDLSNTSITGIPNYCFDGCNKLSSIKTPNTCTSIGTSAFGACYNLGQIVLNEGLTTIGSNAFNTCYAIVSLTLPSTVTSIGSNAFPTTNYALYMLIMNAETPPTLSYSILNDCKYYGMLVYIPSGTLSSYLSSTNWSALSGYYVEV